MKSEGGRPEELPSARGANLRVAPASEVGVEAPWRTAGTGTGTSLGTAYRCRIACIALHAFGRHAAGRAVQASVLPQQPQPRDALPLRATPHLTQQNLTTETPCFRAAAPLWNP